MMAVTKVTTAPQALSSQGPCAVGLFEVTGNWKRRATKETRVEASTELNLGQT